MIRENTQVLFICVGGLAEDVTRYRNKALEQGLSNIRYLGHQEKSLIPKYLVAADILLLPNTDEHEEVRTQTSPLKLFEYLAAGKPIVASDLPAIRSLVSGEEVFFTPAGRSEDLRNAIEAIIAQSHVREQYAHKAYEASLRYTWAIHVSKLKAFLTHIL
jgi:glycosyltransferase involved in cell wall biosynthesis